MSKPNKTPFYIVSCWQLNLSEIENVENTLDAMHMLNRQGVSFKKVVGHYTYDNGQAGFELSLVLPERARVLACKLMAQYNQETILHVEADRSAYLLDRSGERRLGQWSSVTKSQADKLQAFTYDSKTESYYSII